MAEGEFHCKVLFFGSIAEVTGCREDAVTMPSGSTTGDLLNTITSKHDGIATLKNCCAIALNSRLCSKDIPLEQDCTLALLPPVSGG